MKSQKLRCLITTESAMDKFTIEIFTVLDYKQLVIELLTFQKGRDYQLSVCMFRCRKTTNTNLQIKQVKQKYFVRHL